MKKVIFIIALFTTILFNVYAQKTVVITGVNKPDNMQVVVGFFTGYFNTICYALGEVKNGAIRAQIYADDERNRLRSVPWQGSGSYGCSIGFFDDGAMYLYTNGKTLEQLGIVSGMSQLQLTQKIFNIPTVNVNSATTTISFNKFVFFTTRD